MSVTRPVLRYHGGKWKLAPWIISHFPPHRTYVEAFGGGGSILMRKPRVDGEIYNDLDGEVVNVFRILRDEEKSAKLRQILELTPFARAEFRRTYHPPRDEIESAAFVISRSFMGFGSAASTRMHITGFRTSSKRSHGMSSTPAVDWASWPDQVPNFCARLRGVCIENRDAMAVMAQHDSPDTLHYLDPPYVQSTRSSLRVKNGNRGHYYKFDMADDAHRALAEFVHELDGMVMISGYASELYDKLFADWIHFDKKHMADGGRARVERLWMNQACARAQRQGRFSLEHIA